MAIPKISKRLAAAAAFCRGNVRIADIGTDHAYLPIYLYMKGAATGGVVSDINCGPVERARENLAEYGCFDAFTLQCADGLCNVLSKDVDDIFILGMGGELITRIIRDEPSIENARYRLILQPMTHPEAVRGYLYSKGFEIVAESVVEDDKLYQIICAEYTGNIQSADDFELLFGKFNLKHPTSELYDLMKHVKIAYSDRINGKLAAGVSCDYERYIIERIDKFSL